MRYRFVGVVYPGETLVTEMWKEEDKVIFSTLIWRAYGNVELMMRPDCSATKVKERGTVVLAAAAATLVNAGAPKAKL